MAILVIIGIVAFLALDGADWLKRTAGEIVPETTMPQIAFSDDPTAISATSMPQIAFSDDPTAISAASQSVVKLNCYDKNGDLHATGSGFACFADNVIVTNYHVIEGNVYSIEASTENGSTFDIAYVLATDEAKDIAILGTSTPHNLALLQLGNSHDLQKGEKVVAIGSPLGLQNSVSTGVFSGYVDEKGMDVLQFTASISNGSSGGALFSDAGEVLGITFASYEAGQNLNLAIPIEQAEYIYSSNNTVGKVTIAEFYTSNVERRFVCDVRARICHINRTDGCYIAVRGEIFINSERGDGNKYSDDMGEYIYLTLNEAAILGYTPCPDCE